VPQKAMPKFGYADLRSYKIMEGAVRRLETSGAVRHGPECFNYGFPQELDDEFLVISDLFSGVPWRYTDVSGLIEILEEKVDEGFTFPLNPKWILADGGGWKRIYDKLMGSANSNTRDSLNIWYPEEIRSKIADISSKYPRGLDTSNRKRSVSESSGALYDLAEIELQRFEVRLSAQRKVKRWSSRISARPRRTRNNCTLSQSLQGSSCDAQLSSTDLISILFSPEGQPGTSLKLLKQDDSRISAPLSLVESMDEESVEVNDEKLVVPPRQASDNLNNEQLAVSIEPLAGLRRAYGYHTIIG